MKTSSGKVIYLKFTAKSGPEAVVIKRGNKAVTSIMINIIIQNAIIRYLNFNTNAPLEIIEERQRYVNLNRLLNISLINAASITEN